MTQSSRSLRNRLGLIIAAAGLAAIAIGAVAFASGSNPKAHAQSIEGCREYSVCITKQTIGGNGDFDFRAIVDENDYPQICLTPGDVYEIGSAILSDGESFGILIKCAVRIVEQPQPGWRLVDIDCDYDREVWDISPIANGILIVRNASSEDSVSYEINCTFVNSRIEERQPLNLGGLFSGQPTPLPTAPSAVAPAATAPVITPPRTGDAGLR